MKNTAEPEIGRGKFNHYLRSTIGLVRRYRVHFLGSGKSEKFNAFTEMRYALYATDPGLFASMLTRVARASFDAWLAEDVQQQVEEL